MQKGQEVRLNYNETEGLLSLVNVAGMETTVAHCVRRTLYLCGQLMRLVVRVIMQSDRDFMEVIHLQ